MDSYFERGLSALYCWFANYYEFREQKKEGLRTNLDLRLIRGFYIDVFKDNFNHHQLCYNRCGFYIVNGSYATSKPDPDTIRLIFSKKNLSKNKLKSLYIEKIKQIKIQYNLERMNKDFIE